ncbi:MAG: M48 family metalloprotease [Balneolaceae bacterium]|nr:M48 family metalloprotease [Balneolaceae bacterium]
MTYIKKLFKQSFLITLTAAAVALSSCVTIQTSPVSGNKRVYGYTWQQELEIGQEADSEIIAQYGLYDDPELAEYVDRLGQELLEVSHFNREDTPAEYRNTPFTFRVLNSPVVNAFALPGGYVYVTRGLLSHLDNEAQLMVVLGHEIGHVAARHASQRAADQQFGQLAVIGSAIIGESLGYDGGQILQLSGTTAQLLFLRYGRDDERESDQLGVEYSAMEGYEAAEGGKFFTSLKRISEKAGFDIPSHLSSHPDPGEREENIPELAAEWEAQGYEQSIINRTEYMNMIDGLMYGENPREGYVDGNTFYHPELKFQFAVPAGFSVANQPSAVILFNEAQDAIVQFTLDGENPNPKSSVNAFTSQEGINLENQNEIVVNGYPGHTALVNTTTQDGTPVKIQISAVSYDGNLYRFLSYTTSNQFSSYANAFSEVFTSFDAVDDPAVLNVQPARIELQRVRQSGIFSDLIPQNLPMGVDPLDVAILNQVNLDDRIERGAVLKIPKK